MTYAEFKDEQNALASAIERGSLAGVVRLQYSDNSYDGHYHILPLCVAWSNSVPIDRNLEKGEITNLLRVLMSRRYLRRLLASTISVVTRKSYLLVKKRSSWRQFRDDVNEFSRRRYTHDYGAARCRRKRTCCSRQPLII